MCQLLELPTLDATVPCGVSTMELALRLLDLYSRGWEIRLFCSPIGSQKGEKGVAACSSKPPKPTKRRKTDESSDGASGKFGGG